MLGCCHVLGGHVRPVPQGITLVALSTWLGALGSPSSVAAFPPLPGTIASSFTAPSPASGSPSESDEAIESGIVLMAPDLPEQSSDELLVAVVRESVPAGQPPLHVVRYDPANFDRATLVERSQRRAGEWMAHAVLWLDLSGAPDYAIYVFEVDGARVLGRRVPIVDGSTAAAYETLANIATSVVAESMAGPVTGLPQLDPETLEEAAVEPAPPPETPPEPTADPAAETEAEPSSPPPPELEDIPPPTTPRLLLSLGYAGQTFSDDPLLSHGLALGVAWAPAPRAFVGLRYDLVLPLMIDEPTVLASLRRHPISVEGGYRFGLGQRWDLELAGRVSVDPIRRLTDDRSALAVTTDQWRVFSSAALGVGVGVSPIRELRVGLRVGAEALLSSADYAVADPDLRVLVSPHPVRGLIELGVQFSTLWRAKKK